MAKAFENAVTACVSRVEGFWRRMSAGLTVQELWAQFRRDAKSSLAVYDADTKNGEAVSRKRGLPLLIGVIRAIFEKLSPPRRVLLLISLVLLCFFGHFDWNTNGNHVDVEFPGPLLGSIGLLFLLALELADRVSMKRDLEIAREIQNMLLPDAPPVVEGADIAFVTRPANTVAGDYYDAFLRTPAGQPPRLFVLVADVAGKGIPAGMLMATLQANVRAFADEPVSLVEMVSRLNRCTCARSGGGRRFTTAFFAELDSQSGSLSYLNAGHNPPILVRAGGSIEQLTEGGLPLGIQPAAPYQRGTTVLQPGDTLYIYTDGVIEAVNASGEEYGEARLETLLRSQGRLTAAEKLASLIASIGFFTASTPQFDDITCLVLRMTGVAQPNAVPEAVLSTRAG